MSFHEVFFFQLKNEACRLLRAAWHWQEWPATPKFSLCFVCITHDDELHYTLYDLGRGEKILEGTTILLIEDAIEMDQGRDRNPDNDKI